MDFEGVRFYRDSGHFDVEAWWRRGAIVGAIPLLICSIVSIGLLRSLKPLWRASEQQNPPTDASHANMIWLIWAGSASKVAEDIQDSYPLVSLDSSSDETVLAVFVCTVLPGIVMACLEWTEKLARWIMLCKRRHLGNELGFLDKLSKWVSEYQFFFLVDPVLGPSRYIVNFHFPYPNRYSMSTPALSGLFCRSGWLSNNSIVSVSWAIKACAFSWEYSLSCLQLEVSDHPIPPSLGERN